MAEALIDGSDQSSTYKSDSCVVEHCYYAFDTLYCALTREEPVDTEQFQEHLKGDFPLFVTWNTVSSRLLGGVRLRGCIGNFEAMSLDDGIKEYALISALRDHRFRPIEEKELRKLECVILLTDFEDAASYLDWEVGTHGIYITLQLPIRRLTATYLPDVIPAQGWSKQEAVDSALRKAGFDGRITEEVRRAVKLRRYQSSICSARWEEYWSWRQDMTSASD
ncbi:AMMECR1 domain-containing protein [Rhizoctonia solani]|nr:AMMECR1 domain-containing protein [Rhizoctonia solani]